MFLPAAQIAYRKGLACTDALLTISYHLQKSLDTGMESYIVQLEISAAFARVSHSGLLFKLKSIGVGGSVLSICREFLSNRRQRVVVDGAISKRIPIVSAVPQGSVLVLFCSSLIPVKCLCWSGTDYMPLLMTTLPVVARKPADRPAVAASLNRDLARIQECCNHWRMILNRKNTMALVVSGSRTVNPLHGDFILSGVSICASPNLVIICLKFYSRLTFEDHVLGIISSASPRIGILRLVCGHLCVASLPELCSLVNKPSGASAGASDLKY